MLAEGALRRRRRRSLLDSRRTVEHRQGNGREQEKITLLFCPCLSSQSQRVSLCHTTSPAGSLLRVFLGTLGVSVYLDTNSASMPHMCELSFETPGDKV